MGLRRQKRHRRISVTSLIDVIFLLLLFFMLTSTFSRFAEMDLPLGGTATAVSEEEKTLLFLRATESGLTINGQAFEIADLAQIKALFPHPGRTQLIVSFDDAVSSQTLVDILSELKPLEQVDITILGAA